MNEAHKAKELVLEIERKYQGSNENHKQIIKEIRDKIEEIFEDANK